MQKVFHVVNSVTITTIEDFTNSYVCCAMFYIVRLYVFKIFVDNISEILDWCNFYSCFFSGLRGVTSVAVSPSVYRLY